MLFPGIFNFTVGILNIRHTGGFSVGYLFGFSGLLLVLSTQWRFQFLVVLLMNDFSLKFLGQPLKFL